MKRKLSPSGTATEPREREVLQLLADGLGVADLTPAVHQRVDHEDPHLEVV